MCPNPKFLIVEISRIGVFGQGVLEARVGEAETSHDTLGSASAVHRERDTSLCVKGGPESVEASPASEWF